MRNKGEKMGRIYYAHPITGDRFYMRMLLNIVTGLTCYVDIRTVNGVCYETFKAACVAHVLLEDDNEWNEAILKGCQWASPLFLREMFTTLLLFCEISNPSQFWENH